MRAVKRLAAALATVVSFGVGYMALAEPASATNSFCGDVGIAYATNNGKIIHIECNDGTRIDIRGD